MEQLYEGVEFPVVAPSRCTLPTRYIYAAKTITRGRGHIEFSGVVKFDTTNRSAEMVVGVAEFGLNTFGGEGLFVPRCEREEKTTGELVLQ